MSDPDAKIKVTDQHGEVEIIGNREGLLWLSEICAGLASLTEAEAKTPANHYHINPSMGHGTQDTVDAIILCQLDLS